MYCFKDYPWLYIVHSPLVKISGFVLLLIRKDKDLIRDSFQIYNVISFKKCSKVLFYCVILLNRSGGFCCLLSTHIIYMSTLKMRSGIGRQRLYNKEQ